ncbi:atherin-like isoform X2 [Panthera tigris]|uniref:atherin-like isoform X2 n=1 Tax=Panthera tigris TaxID=9694 RepID=UPI001C6F9BFA|nr:atherin-like isoform X2 [Panthera tigris]
MTDAFTPATGWDRAGRALSRGQTEAKIIPLQNWFLICWCLPDSKHFPGRNSALFGTRHRTVSPKSQPICLLQSRGDHPESRPHSVPEMIPRRLRRQEERTQGAAEKRGRGPPAWGAGEGSQEAAACPGHAAAPAGPQPPVWGGHVPLLEPHPAARSLPGRQVLVPREEGKSSDDQDPAGAPGPAPARDEHGTRCPGHSGQRGTCPPGVKGLARGHAGAGQAAESSPPPCPRGSSQSGPWTRGGSSERINDKTTDAFCDFIYSGWPKEVLQIIHIYS